MYTAPEGGTVTLRCKVDSSPEPNMVFYRDPAQRQAVIDGGNYVITLSSGRKVRREVGAQVAVCQVRSLELRS